MTDCSICKNYEPVTAKMAGQKAVKENPDVVQVVRCKDCGWWNEDDSAGWGDLGNNVCACAYFSNEDGYTVYTEPNDYCSKGQRKEGEG